MGRQTQGRERAEWPQLNAGLFRCLCNGMSASPHLHCGGMHACRGTLGPEEFSLLKVVYTPKHTGTFTCENYVISTAGGNRVTLTLRGTATGPRVTLSTRAFNFGSVLCGSLASRVLYLTNHSDIAVAYDFQVSQSVSPSV